MIKRLLMEVALVAAVFSVWLGFGWLSSEVRQISHRLRRAGGYGQRGRRGYEPRPYGEGRQARWVFHRGRHP